MGKIFPPFDFLDLAEVRHQIGPHRINQRLIGAKRGQRGAEVFGNTTLGVDIFETVSCLYWR